MNYHATTSEHHEDISTWTKQTPKQPNCSGFSSALCHTVFLSLLTFLMFCYRYSSIPKAPASLAPNSRPVIRWLRRKAMPSPSIRFYREPKASRCPLPTPETSFPPYLTAPLSSQTTWNQLCYQCWTVFLTRLACTFGKKDASPEVQYFKHR